MDKTRTEKAEKIINTLVVGKVHHELSIAMIKERVKEALRAPDLSEDERNKIIKISELEMNWYRKHVAMFYEAEKFLKELLSEGSAD